MTRAIGALTTGVLCAACGTASGEQFDDFATFEAAVGTIASDPLDGLPTGTFESLALSSGDFSYTITTIGQEGGAANGGLTTRGGYLSTESALDAIMITFTGADVYGFGTNLFGVFANGDIDAGYPIIDVSDGSRLVHTLTEPDDFSGYVSDTAFESVTIWMPEARFIAVDNLTFAGAVPTPAGLSLLGLGCLASSRRRR